MLDASAEDSFSLKFKRLPLHLRLVFIGLLTGILGAFLPWYSDLDSFKNGISFLGITGPTAIVGFTIILLNTYAIAALLKHIKKNNRNLLAEKKHSIENWIGIFNIYLLIVVAFFYTSSYFGEEISRKSMGIGYYISLTGGIISFLGMILFKEKKKVMNVNESVDIDEENQLGLGITELVDDSGSDFELPFFNHELNNKTRNLVSDLVFSKDPVSKEMLKKQKEIEAKITNKQT
jgi:hypothetical protein